MPCPPFLSGHLCPTTWGPTGGPGVPLGVLISWATLPKVCNPNLYQNRQANTTVLYPVQMTLGPTWRKGIFIILALVMHSQPYGAPWICACDSTGASLSSTCKAACFQVGGWDPACVATARPTLILGLICLPVFPQMPSPCPPGILHFPPPVPSAQAS